MPSTKRGIYHNLKESKYTISNTEIVFFFSSKVYMKKFMVRYKENRLKYGKRIDDIPINLDSVADIELYESIEKRGFRVLLFGVDITKQELVSYAIRQMKNKDTHDWNIIEAPSTKERIKLMK